MDIFFSNKKTKMIKDYKLGDLQEPINTDEKKYKELIDKNLKLEDIQELFKLLFTDNEKEKAMVSTIINEFISTLNSNQLLKVDALFRERASFDWNYGWRNKEPKNLINSLMSEEEKITILGLSSFHPSGYFREKAIIALSAMNRGGVIPYLLIRVNDWASEVRCVSKEKLLRFITIEHALDLANNLPLVLRLRECFRDNHSEILEKVISILSSEEGSKKLVKGLESIDPKVRLACYKIIIEKKVIDNRSIINYLIKEINPFNKLFVLKNIRDEITRDEFVDISKVLLNDKFGPIKILAIELIYSFGIEYSISVLEEGIFDNNKSVRELSRYFLSKGRKYDFASIYIDAIQKNEKIYSAICGLGEVGSKTDSEIIIKFIDSDIVKIAKASINSLARLDIERYKGKIIMSLNDERAGISKSARKVLCRNIYSSDVDIIYRFFYEANYNHVKINCCIILCSLSKWQAIRYIIEFCSNESKNISKLGQSALERWILRYNQSFVSPTKNEIGEIRKSLESFGSFIEGKHREFIETCIKGI